MLSLPDERCGVLTDLDAATVMMIQIITRFILRVCPAGELYRSATNASFGIGDAGGRTKQLLSFEIEPAGARILTPYGQQTALRCQPRATAYFRRPCKHCRLQLPPYASGLVSSGLYKLAIADAYCAASKVQCTLSSDT
jgi:hypothetical protein